LSEKNNVRKKGSHGKEEGLEPEFSKLREVFCSAVVKDTRDTRKGLVSSKEKRADSEPKKEPARNGFNSCPKRKPKRITTKKGRRKGRGREGENRSYLRKKKKVQITGGERCPDHKTRSWDRGKKKNIQRAEQDS